MNKINYVMLSSIIVFGLLIGCEETPSSDEAKAIDSTDELLFSVKGNNIDNMSKINRQVAKLRRVTARYHQFSAAQEDGYTMQVTECMSIPEGGMGFHYGNPEYIDDKVVVAKPEVLLYEPEPNGRLRLVGIEYIVPFDLWTENDPPSLYGHSFHRDEFFGVWALHVWAWKHNPTGIFSNWNPRVNCP